jgi:hypothetical protein
MAQMARANGHGLAREAPPIVLLDRAERAREGNGELTAWCETCQERAVPMRDGTCGFCNTKIAPAFSEHSPGIPDTATLPVATGDSEPAGMPETCPEHAGGMLRLGDDLFLPLDAATQSLAILAVKGAGKSNAAAVLVEEFSDEGIPFVVIDPKGDWYGIREAVDGTRGLPALVLGGEHGDLPLSPWDGARVAELIVERNLPCVLDISAMDDEERPEFLAPLGNALFELHRTNPTVRHIVVEEAVEVVPERSSKEMRDTLKAWTRIVCQGRQRGIGITLVSQRSALISKNVLTQTAVLLVLRTTSPQDRKVIRDWTDFHSVSRELVDSLPGMADGEAWIVAPSWLGRVERVRLRRRWTFDSGATPEVVSARQPQLLDSLDIEEIGRMIAGEAPASDSVTSDEEPEAEQAPLHTGATDLDRDVILERLADGPCRRGELLEVTGLRPSTLHRLLRRLADEDLVHMLGKMGGALWALGPEPDPETASAAETETATTAAARIAQGRRLSEEALEQLDALLDDADGITLLRARYLAALLARIEAGDTSCEMLDRFERVAGFEASA